MFGDMISLTLCNAEAHTHTHIDTLRGEEKEEPMDVGGAVERERGPTLWAAG